LSDTKTRKGFGPDSHASSAAQRATNISAMGHGDKGM
jgi:hypothetical protein